MKQIGVECRFSIDGTIEVHRIYQDKDWVVVSQGRQWVDRQGRHVLIMLPDNQAREILLRPESMTWVLLPVPGRSYQVV